MKRFLFLATTVVSLGLSPAFAQLGGGGPQFAGAMNKLFGANQTFSATVAIQADLPDGNSMTLPGKVNFDTGKSRLDVNMSDMQGGALPPGTLERFKAMGLDAVVSIFRPDLKLTYVIYPNLKSYAQMESGDSSAGTNDDDYTVETTKLGSETVDGHDCVKNKVIVTDKQGNKTEATVWDATDLKNFPIKMVVTGRTGQPATLLFKNISFTKPDAGLFNAPTGFTKYDNIMDIMRAEMAKHQPGTPPSDGQN